MTSMIYHIVHYISHNSAGFPIISNWLRAYITTRDSKFLHSNLYSASDFNFERFNIDSPCIPVRGHDPYAVPSDCPEGTNYTVSTG